LADATRPLLQVDAVVTGYGKKLILNGITLSVGQGEIVALIGHNGAGKSTLLRTIFGLQPLWEGKLFFDGQSLKSAKPRDLLHMGIAYVPQGNRVFTDLTVRENLAIGGITLENKKLLHEGITRALILFPVLRERLKQRAATLSGGQKQMLALANAIVLSPRFLLLDEPSLGLAPPLVTAALSRIQQLNRDGGLTVLIVEQKVREVLNICQRVCCLKLGKVTYDGSPEPLKSDPDKLRQVFL